MKKLSSNSFKVSVAPESGADATTYSLIPSVTQVKRKADGTHLPEYVSCECYSKTGDGNPVPGGGTIKFVLTYKTGSTSSEFIYASRIIITSDMSGISFRLYVGGTRVDEKTVLVVEDGQDGDDGHSPYISGHGTWMVWDATYGMYVDSGDPAIGDDGKSPKIEGGTWWVYENGIWKDTGIKAEGKDGDDGHDGVFMKQIFIQSDTRPDAPHSSSIPEGWSESPEFGKLSVLGYSGDFYLTHGGRRSPKSPAQNGMYMDKLRFTTSDPRQQIVLKIDVSSESNYDWAYVGYVDSALSETNFHTRKSGILSFNVVQEIQEAGEHYIEVMYRKDTAGNIGEDMMKYSVVSNDTIWVSSAQATYNKASSVWTYGTWSRPSRYLADTPNMEYIFRRSDRIVPDSDPLVDNFIPAPFGSEEDYRGEFSLTSAQVVNAIYKSGENYYKCIKARPANAVPEITVTDKSYFLYLIPFTDNPLGVTEETPKEYMSFRKKTNGKWGAFSDPKLHANYAKGEDGLPGPAGERGRMPYPAGFWQEDIEYTATDAKTPIAYYEVGKTYYVMNKTTTVIGLNPVTDYAQNGKDATWIPFENYKAIFTEILMANFAKLASSVFFGDYMFSQQGIDANGNDTSDYGLFDPAKIGQDNNPFTPNLMLDMLLGKFSGLDVDIKGGKIGGWDISNESISSEEISQSIGGVTYRSRTVLRKDGTILGNLLKVSLDGGFIRSQLWESPVLEWKERKIDMHAIFSVPFELISAIKQPSSGNPSPGYPYTGIIGATNNMIVEPSYLPDSKHNSSSIAYYRLSANLDIYNGVTLRLYNPPTRSFNWKACTAVFMYNMYLDDNDYWVDASEKAYFQGKYSGTDLVIPPGRMVVITGVREAINGGTFGQDVLKWYVEVTA